MELGGQNICSTTFAPHVWHLMGKLGVNLPHLPYLPPPSKQAQEPLILLSKINATISNDEMNQCTANK
jgi:hypothetical protein